MSNLPWHISETYILTNSRKPFALLYFLCKVYIQRTFEKRI